MKYRDIQYLLMQIFMIKAGLNILDVSFQYEANQMIIQVVLIENTNLSEGMKRRVKEQLTDFEITFNEFHISKEKFNENVGEWQPRYYKWLKQLLFSKAEA